ncbi:Retrovirus-related Pol polyprotein from transposon 17.6, partial [Mucuna pruriens]
MVKKEVTKLLVVGIIYLISNRQWVSPVQVVPKKSGITTRMPFGLCNASSAFQRFMTSIFSDLLQDCMEVFIDDFTVYADSFDACMENLSKVLVRCIDINLVLNFEKCHFMVTEGIVLGHMVSNRGIEVDKSKIDIITSLSNPASVWEVRSFLGHAGFYRRFIKNFSKSALPLSKLLQKDQLLHINTPTPWFASICNFVAASRFPLEAFRLYKERLQSDAKYNIWDNPYLWRLYNDQIIRRCILDIEIKSVLQFCQVAPGGSHYGSTQTARKALDCRFY